MLGYEHQTWVLESRKLVETKQKCNIVKLKDLLQHSREY